ncbi:AAA family ATPase [Fodinibius sediminis]|uniref:AAA domain-containing protein n=1 Tax=Fodinibius sediminis TaxID=1214077 RepID=A0A521AV24_9BACT|nr:AAA family ATPase [Fodinibius sediminis]SMO38571.1 AAA domain-containing protein [Fodinibius sediminis]
MKIKSIKLHPFAGIQEKEVNLTDGLNLVLGPNEVGKSTIFHAIHHGLLTSSNLTSRDFDDKMDPFLPIGGDVIRVTLMIYKSDPDTCYEIRKTWRPGLRNGEATLIKPAGTEVNDEDNVQSIIESLIPASPSTVREVMMSRQSGLHEIMERMDQHSEVQQELSDVLRQNVMEAGGMSVDKFREKVESEFKTYFGKWDRDKNYPQKDSSGRDRGVQNPWQQGVGVVLEAWYQKANARKHYDKIISYEEQLDELNSQLEELNAELSEKEQEYSNLSPIQEELQQREVLESKLETIEEKFGRVKEIAKKWPVYEDKIENLTPELEELNEQLDDLAEEQQKAAKKSKIENLKQRVEKLSQLENRIKEARKDLEEAKEITEKDIAELRELKGTIRDLRTTIRASKLKLSVTALQDTEITVSNIDGEEASWEISKGEDLEVEKEGFVTLKTDTLQLTVKSSTDDLESVIEELEAKEEQLKGKLEKLEVKDFEDAVSDNKLYEDYKKRLNQATRQFKDELGDDEYEDLKTKLEEAGDVEGVRELGVIQEERDQLQEKRRELKNELDKMREALSTWKDEYDDDIDNLFSERADLTSSKKEIEGRLEELPDLPEQFDSVKAFNNYLGSLDGSIDDLKEQRGDLREELAELNGGAPQESSDEYEEVVNELTSNFERIKQKAESIAKVKEETTDILAGLEDETYQPLVESFTGWLGEMSDGRFQEVKQDGELPDAFLTPEQTALTFEKLSHGTKDLTALAWKLTASEYFLNDQSSLLVLDDPMVDMDPDRRKQAASALQKFAEEHQVLIFTCHPYYQDVLEVENLIELE